MKKIFIATLCAAAASLFADNYSDMSAYKAGDSLAWFHDLKRQSQTPKLCPEIEAKILAEIGGKKLSGEAFRLACSVLKPIAGRDSIDVLKPYLYDEAKAPYVCDVFAGLDYSAVDSAAVDVLENPEAKIQLKENAVALLALRGAKKGAVIDAANAADKELALFAVRSLARYEDETGLLSLFESSAIDALAEIQKKNDFRAKTATQSLVFIAQRAIAQGNKSAAKKALEFVPQDCPNAVFARSELMDADARVKYLDALIAEGGAQTAAAAKAMNKGRTFANSAWLVGKFPSLNKKAKLAAMGSFMITGDTAFYPIIAAELSNPDADIRALAIYSARFLCTDDANMEKIFGVFKSGEEPFSKYAENVLLENSGYAVQRVLKEHADTGDMQALEILVKRGNETYRMKLWNMFFDESQRTPAVCRMLENTITAGQVNLLATNFKVRDAELSKEIAKIIIKKMMQYKLSPEYIKKAVHTALDGNLSPDDPNYKFILSKLKIL